MTKHHFPLRLFLSALITCLVGPSLAQAQMTATYLEYGSRGAPGTNSSTYFINWPVSADECTANDPIEVQLQNAPFITGTTYTMALWLASAGGTSPTACNLGMNRSGTTPPCTRVTTFDQPTLTAVNQVIAIPPQVFFGTDCSATGDLVFFLMAMSSPTDISSDVPATNFVTLRIMLDRTPPDAPTVADAAGDENVTVSWTNPTDTNTLYAANIYVDRTGTCGSGDGGTGSSVLVEDGTPPASITPVTITGGSPTSGAVNLSFLDYGESVPVAVTLVDLARNESVLSNVACLTRVQVEGFWDAYCRENGYPDTVDGRAACRAAYDGCSASPGRGNGSALALLVSALVMFVVRRAVRGKGAA